MPAWILISVANNSTKCGTHYALKGYQQIEQNKNLILQAHVLTVARRYIETAPQPKVGERNCSSIITHEKAVTVTQITAMTLCVEAKSQHY